MTTTEPCKHRNPVLHQDGLDGGWAECRDCDKVAAYWVDFEEWTQEPA